MEDISMSMSSLRIRNINKKSKDKALAAITALNEDWEKLKNSLLAPTSNETPEDRIKSMSKHLTSLDAHFRGADSSKALEAITALKKDWEKLENGLLISNIPPRERIVSMRTRLDTLQAYFRGADRGGGTLRRQHSPSQATNEVDKALNTLETLRGKSGELINMIESLAPTVAKLEAMNNAIQTLNRHLSITC